MTRIRRSIDIVSIEVIPQIRATRDKCPWDMHEDRHDWILRENYSHLSVRICAVRHNNTRRSIQQSFRVEFSDYKTETVLASRTVCIPIESGECETEVTCELSLSLVHLAAGIPYIAQVFELNADEYAVPLCSTPVRFFNLREWGLPPTAIYVPHSAWFSEKDPDEDRPLYNSPHYIEAPMPDSYMTVRFSSPINLSPIKMPEIKARMFFGFSVERQGYKTLYLRAVPPCDGVPLEENVYESTFRVPSKHNEIFWIEFETLGYPFAYIVGNCRGNDVEGELDSISFEKGGVDPEELGWNNIFHWTEILDKRADRLTEKKSVYDLDIDSMLEEFIESQLEDDDSETSESSEGSDYSDNSDYSDTSDNSDDRDRPGISELANAPAVHELPIPEFDEGPKGIEGLRSMVGLSEVKEQVETTAQTMRFFRMRRDKGLRIKPVSLHSLFLGGPGTGKTTVARHMGEIMREAGALTSGHVIETERAKLVGQYYSSTNENTLKALEEAEGGILFIDEAYQLYVPEDRKDPGRDVLNTLMTFLADESKRNTMIILGGYPSKTLELLAFNPGLRSRFPEQNFYHFEDYSPKELLTIAEDWFLREEYLLTPEARYRLAERLERDWRRRDETFGNARHVITMIEKEIIPAMASRVLSLNDPDEEALMTILPQDVA